MLRRAGNLGFKRKYSGVPSHPPHLQRRYTKDHEWVSFDPKSKTIALVGITEYAQSAIGDIVFVSLPQMNQAVKKGDELGSVESVKGANSIYSPISGVVKEINVVLSNSPELMNTSPYELGWFCKIEAMNVQEVQSLLDEHEYKEHCESSV